MCPLPCHWSFVHVDCRQLGEFSEWEKFTNFELSARVPLLFRVPWLADKHTRLISIVELVDVAPTLFELASLSLPSTEPVPLDGKSLVPLMVSGGSSADAQSDFVAMTQFPRCVFGVQFGLNNRSLPLWALNDCDGIQRSEFSYMGLSMRTDRWRFTRWYPWNGTTLEPQWKSPAADIATELYDHEDDDGTDFSGNHESANLAAVPSYARTVAELTKQLEAVYGRDTPDPTPIKPPAPVRPGNCSTTCASKPGCDCHCFCQVCHGKCGDGCYDKCLRGSGCSAHCLH
eukprot:COSAG03_NODE_106_length_12644_cov_262.577840_7_plen_287_part_00